jgi:hypothetical protein
MSKVKRIDEYVAAVRALKSLEAKAEIRDDIPGYEQAIKDVKYLVKSLRAGLTGGDLGKANRILGDLCACGLPKSTDHIHA